MSRAYRAFGIVVLGGLGVLFSLAGLHLYVDHQLLHVLVSIEQARQKQLQEK